MIHHLHHTTLTYGKPCCKFAISSTPTQTFLWLMANVNTSNTPRGASSFSGSGLMGQSSGGFADPLATSGGGFGDVDPWSGTQSPARAATPQSSIEPGLNTGNGRSSGDGHDSFGTPQLDALIGAYSPSFASLTVRRPARGVHCSV